MRRSSTAKPAPQRRAPVPNHKRSLGQLASAIGAMGLYGLVSAGCGASINATYEGDVRFERCMALDEQQQATDDTRRRCWNEWLRFYTFGQVRDRVDYARSREKLADASETKKPAEVAPEPAKVVPEPTSVLVPPPMMINSPSATESDATEMPSQAPNSQEEKAQNACTEGCDTQLALCIQSCKTPACEKTCAAGRRRCERDCR